MGQAANLKKKSKPERKLTGTRGTSFLEKTPPPSRNAPLNDWALWYAEIGSMTGAWKVFPCV